MAIQCTTQQHNKTKKLKGLNIQVNMYIFNVCFGHSQYQRHGFKLQSLMSLDFRAPFQTIHKKIRTDFTRYSLNFGHSQCLHQERFTRYSLNCIKKFKGPYKHLSAISFSNKILRLFIYTNKKAIKRWHNILCRDGAIYYSFYKQKKRYILPSSTKEYNSHFSMSQTV